MVIVAVWPFTAALPAVAVPEMVTPVAASLRLRILSPAIGVVIATVGKVSATVTLWVASADELPLASVTWADTVAVLLASARKCVVEGDGVQLVRAAFMVAV